LFVFHDMEARFTIDLNDMRIFLSHIWRLDLKESFIKWPIYPYHILLFMCATDRSWWPGTDPRFVMHDWNDPLSLGIDPQSCRFDPQALERIRGNKFLFHLCFVGGLNKLLSFQIFVKDVWKEYTGWPLNDMEGQYKFMVKHVQLWNVVFHSTSSR